MTQYCTPKISPLACVLVTEDNLDTTAAWCGGQVRGIRLPLKDQIIQWYDQGWEMGDLEARVGDWIVRFGGRFSAYDDKAFHATFDIVEKTTEWNRKP